MIKAAVLGSPISHSLSPALHNFAYKFLGIEGTYSSFDVKSGELADFLNAQGSTLTGLSLTMPLKEEAIELAGEISPLARQISSANTLHKVNDIWNATTTDVAGFTYAFSFNHIAPPSDVLIIGSGATARAAAAAVDSSASTIYVVGRNPKREHSLLLAAPHSRVVFLPWAWTELINSVDLVINTTPSNTGDFFVDNVSDPKGTFFEVIYNPWPTQLLARWSKTSRVIDGLDLLIHQAISQIEIFTHSSIEREELVELLRKHLLEKLS